MENFRPYIFPQTVGTVEEVQKRSDLGQAKFPRLVEFRNQLLREFMREVRPENLVDNLNLFNISYPITEGEYILNFDPKMDAEELSRIVSPCIEIAKDILQQHQILIPDDLLSRVYVIEEQTFNNVVLQELDEDPYSGFVAGATLPNRLVILSGRRVNLICDKQNIDRDHFIRVIVMSELIGHSLVYKEAWIPQNEDSSKTPDQWGVKRHGLIISPPKPNSKTFLMTSLLHEGFTQYFTRAILKFHGDQVLDLDKYPSETRVIEEMVNGLGIKVLFRAAYLQEGYRDFAMALQERYGKGALGRIIKLMDIDQQTEEAARRMYNIKYPPFKNTLNFLSKPSDLDD